MGNLRPSKVQGSYVREAWLNGLELAAQGITNPFAFGVIGSRIPIRRALNTMKLALLLNWESYRQLLICVVLFPWVS